MDATIDDNNDGQFEAHFGIKPNEAKTLKIQIDFLGSVSSITFKSLKCKDRLGVQPVG